MARRNSVRDFVADSHGVLIDPHAPTALAQIMADILNDPDRARAMGAASLQKAEQFSIQRRAQNILAWLDEIRELHAAQQTALSRRAFLSNWRRGMPWRG